jgi:hypothetical protein
VPKKESKERFSCITITTWRIFWIPACAAPGPATAEGRWDTTSAEVASPSRISQRPKAGEHTGEPGLLG